MLTFEQVLEIFKDYLETDDEVEVLLTKRGYLRIVWPGDFSFCDDGKLCRTPESDCHLIKKFPYGYWQEVFSWRGLYWQKKESGKNNEKPD